MQQLACMTSTGVIELSLGATLSRAKRYCYMEAHQPLPPGSERVLDTHRLVQHTTKLPIFPGFKLCLTNDSVVLKRSTFLAFLEALGKSISSHS